MCAFIFLLPFKSYFNAQVRLLKLELDRITVKFAFTDKIPLKFNLFQIQLEFAFAKGSGRTTPEASTLPFYHHLYETLISLLFSLICSVTHLNWRELPSP